MNSPIPALTLAEAELEKHSPIKYRYKYFTNVGREVKGECSTEAELRRVFSREDWPGKNFRKYSTDQGRTWTDY
jgi:hypothetical protein